MTKYAKKIKPPKVKKVPPKEPGMTYVYRWELQEAIDNWDEDPNPEKADLVVNGQVIKSVTTNGP
jgi:hypothetical protein